MTTQEGSGDMHADVPVLRGMGNPAHKSIVLSSTLPLQDCLTQGDTAPDFSADAYVRGRQRRIQLRDYRGKWVLITFYSSDFTFV